TVWVTTAKHCQRQRQKTAATKITSWAQVQMVSRKHQSGHNQSQVFLLI
ncbi:molybdopterin oxidoreductase family protein, partial [Vibrio parahaemolyticus V-223/04]